MLVPLKSSTFETAATTRTTRFRCDMRSGADANTSDGGTLIEFESVRSGVESDGPTVLHLESTLSLTQTAGPITLVGVGANFVIDGSKYGIVMPTGGISGSIFSIAPGVNANFRTSRSPAATRHQQAAASRIVVRWLSSIPASPTLRLNTVVESINEGNLTVTGSTLSGNSASGSGGGILNFGTLVVTDSTLSGNSAGQAAACSRIWARST